MRELARLPGIRVEGVFMTVAALRADPGAVYELQRMRRLRRSLGRMADGVAPMAVGIELQASPFVFVLISAFRAAVRAIVIMSFLAAAHAMAAGSGVPMLGRTPGEVLGEGVRVPEGYLAASRLL